MEIFLRWGSFESKDSCAGIYVYFTRYLSSSNTHIVIHESPSFGGALSLELLLGCILQGQKSRDYNTI